ncbi:Arm DNA-binding domain-containing protein [Massilia sp. TS11]|uniref:Arm DNA-binding domain-containing protein n=1 Tax=Massilia sp. TS11 TaxID=2908003 RepID=UPI001ED9DF49|nr:Arm DNA-binding domain-containing protein [Massilia sp. TS11]MCG2586618.1 Arm DNA-binding domain-containing protein [Massilia sp. TS11]
MGMLDAGKQEKRTLGKCPALTLKNARTLHHKAAEEVAVGDLSAQEKPFAKTAQARNTTVAEFAERFFREVQMKVNAQPRLPLR